MSGHAPSLVMGPGATDELPRFIQKPFTLAELSRGVEEALGRASPAGS
jgi:hypothetical protein